MGEIFLIILQFFILHLFFSYPLNTINYKKLNLQFQLNYFDIIFCNVIIQTFILLIISFFKINFLAYFLVILAISLVINFINFEKNFISNLNIYTIIFPIICLSIFFDISSRAVLEWDGLAHWFWKASNFYQNQGISNIKNLPLPQYPHLGPFLWAFFWKNSFSTYEYIGRLFIPYIYIVSLFTITFDIQRKLSGVIFVLTLILLSYDTFIFGGYQEYITFAFFCFLSKLVFLNKKNLNNKIFISTFIIIGSICLLWVKQECLFYVIFFNFCYLFTINKNSEKILHLILIATCIVLYFIIEKNIKGTFELQTTVNLSNFEKFKNMNLIFVYLAEITKHIFIAFFKYPILILNIFILYFLIMNAKMKNQFVFILLFYLLNFIFLYVVYFIHPAPLSEMLPNTVDRLLFQISSVPIIFLRKWVNNLKF